MLVASFYSAHGLGVMLWLGRTSILQSNRRRRKPVNGRVLYWRSHQIGTKFMRHPLLAHLWILISESKHPVMKGHRDDVIKTLTQPDEIRRSRKDESVLLFYRGTAPRWICAVTKNVDGHDGYLITAYPTDRIKIGDVIWKK